MPHKKNSTSQLVFAPCTIGCSSHSGLSNALRNVLMYSARSAIHSVCALGKAWELCCGALTGQKQ